MNAGMQVKYVSEGVGSRPGLGKIAVEIHLFVTGDQAIEE